MAKSLLLLFVIMLMPVFISQTAVSAAPDSTRTGTHAAASKADDAMCRALKRGDYSAFAGIYEPADPNNKYGITDLTLARDGSTVGGTTDQTVWRYHTAPESVTQMEFKGEKYYRCVLKTWTEIRKDGVSGNIEEYFDIHPDGISNREINIPTIVFHRDYHTNTTGSYLPLIYILKTAAPSPTPAASQTRFTLSAGTEWITGTTTTNGRPIIYTYTVPPKSYYYFQIETVKGGAGSALDFMMSDDENAYVTGKENLTSYKSDFYTNRKKGKVTFKIYGTNRNKATGYRIRLIQKKSGDFEQEPNDSEYRSNILKMGASSVATLLGLASKNDVDYFAFIAPIKGTYQIRVRNNGNGSVRFRLYNSNGKLLKTIKAAKKGIYVSFLNRSMKKKEGIYIAADSGRGQFYNIRIKKAK